ncbi:MAG: FAD-dependent oxidoreductase [Pseudomonadota bacterium]
MTDVLIVGAGMAGIACARHLIAAGRSVVLLDKGRGIGGRVATRRAEAEGTALQFDHGAQNLPVGDPRINAVMVAAADVLHSWETEPGRQRQVGRPGMSALPKALAQGLDIRLQTQVTALTHDAQGTGEGSGWRAKAGSGASWHATHAVMTVPAPQVAPILGPEHPLSAVAEGVPMEAVLTLMAAFAAPSPAPFVTRRDPEQLLTWIAQDSTKPGRASGSVTWVAQAAPDWSAVHFDAPRGDTAKRMLAMLCAEIGAEPRDAVYASAHGWRYAHATTPLGKPFVTDNGVWVGGDWTLGPRIGDAWASGTAIAQAILAAST